MFPHKTIISYHSAIEVILRLRIHELNPNAVYIWARSVYESIQIAH